MGKNFVCARQNRFDVLQIYRKLIERDWLEYSSGVKPSFSSLEEIELGTDGTSESILRFENNLFIVVDGTFDEVKNNE